MDRRQFLTGFAAVFAAPTLQTPAWGDVFLPASRTAEPFIPVMQLINQQVNQVIELSQAAKPLRHVQKSFYDPTQPQQYRELVVEINQITSSMLRLMKAELPALPQYEAGSEYAVAYRNVMSVNSKNPEDLNRVIQWRTEDQPSAVSLATMPLKVIVELVRLNRAPINHMDSPEFYKFLQEQGHYTFA